MRKFKFVFSVTVLCIVLFCCFVAPTLNGIDPNLQHIELRNDTPSANHLFGTDSLGRDIFTRVCVGGRVSLLVAFVCTIFATTFGCLYGGISAFFFRIDGFMMLFLDIFSSIPDILLVIVLSLWLDSNSIVVLAFSISMVGWCKIARIVRSLLKPLKSANYVIEARSLGKNGFYTICFHMLPNILSSIIARAVLSIPEFIFYESFLSYLGIGVRPPEASWGSLISEAQKNFMFHPCQLIVTSLFLILVLLSVTWLGDCINDSAGHHDKTHLQTSDIWGRKATQPLMTDTKEFDWNNNVLVVQNLSIRYQQSDCISVDNVSFSIGQGEIIGLVGQSGCGKTSIARAVSGILSLYHGIISSESKMIFDGKQIHRFSETAVQNICCREGIAVIYQDALSCLDPTMKIGKQMAECFSQRGKYSKSDSQRIIKEYLYDVGLNDKTDELLELYPYQLSGGIAQRILIAMAIMANPKLLICDEPTASLDYINCKKIVALLKRLSEIHGTSILFITHDISIVKEIASKILIMDEGAIVDFVTPENFERSSNVHTKQLVEAAFMNRAGRKDFHTSPTTLRVEHLYYRYPKSSFDAIENVSFKLKQGEVFGILGESGSGKTTLSKLIFGYLHTNRGTIQKDIPALRVQYLFQNPLSAFDPSWTVGKSILEGVSDSKTGNNFLNDLLQQVGLDFSVAKRYPDELSLGQCQRAAIARAIAVDPQLIICDEPTSALDMVNQKRILELLMQLNSERKRTYIFVSHDLNVINYVSDRIAVMYKGKFVEIAFIDEFYNHTCHPYSQMLISGKLSSAEPLVLNKQFDESGCDYYPICSKKTDICKCRKPELKKLGNATLTRRHHLVACHNIE